MPSKRGEQVFDLGALVLLCATLFLLPFERPLPLVALAGTVVTNLEAVLLLTLTVWLCGVLWRRSFQPPFFIWPAAVIVLAVFLSALAVPSFQVGALKVATR